MLRVVIDAADSKAVSCKDRSAKTQIGYGPMLSYCRESGTELRSRTATVSWKVPRDGLKQPKSIG